MGSAIKRAGTIQTMILWTVLIVLCFFATDLFALQGKLASLANLCV